MNSPRPRQHQSQTRTRSRRTGRTYFGIYLAELPWGAPRLSDDGARQIERLCKRATLNGALSFVVMALVYGGLLASGAIQPNLVAARARNMRLALEGDAEAMSRLAGQFRDGRGDGDRFSAHVH